MNAIFSKYYDVLSAVITSQGIKDLEERWSEPWRFYHTIEHLTDILNQIEKHKSVFFTRYEDYRVMVIAAFLHDAVYDPKRNDNEDKSIELFKSMCSADRFLEPVIKLIEITKKQELSLEDKNNNLISLFWRYDRNILTQDFATLLDYENKIYKEYQFANYDEYKAKRVEFLESCLCQDNDENISALISFVKNRKPKVGVYPGSFDPFTIGHKNILDKAEEIFDKVIIAYGHNPAKEYKTPNVPNTLDKHCVKEYNGLLTDFVIQEEGRGQNITLIRGLRNGYDLAYENNQLQFLKEMKSDIKVIFIISDKEFEHISSSDIRNLYPYGENSWKKYVVE